MNGIGALIFIIIMIVLGILYCFWGYRFLKIAMLVYAFFAGFLFITQLLGQIAPELSENTVWIIALAVGIVLALLAFFFIKFCIFVAGGIAGVLIFMIVREAFPQFFGQLDGIFVFLIGLAFFLVLGAITLAARKHLIIIFSALFGAYSMVYAAGIFLGLVIHPEALYSATMANAISTLGPYSVFAGAQTWVMMLPIAVFTIAGIIAQYKFTSKKAKNY